MAMAAAPATTRAAMAAGCDLKAPLSVCSASAAEEEADWLDDLEELALEEAAGELEAAEDDTGAEELEGAADEAAAELLAGAELLAAEDAAAEDVGAKSKRELILYNDKRWVQQLLTSAIASLNGELGAVGNISTITKDQGIYVDILDDMQLLFILLLTISARLDIRRNRPSILARISIDISGNHIKMVKIGWVTISKLNLGDSIHIGIDPKVKISIIAFHL